MTFCLDTKLIKPDSDKENTTDRIEEQKYDKV